MLTNLAAKFREKLNSDFHFAELIKGSSTAFILRVVGILAGYIFTLIITRKYGAKAMGIFALSFTLLQISSVIGRLGMDIALLKFVSEYSVQNKWGIIKEIYKKSIKIVLPISFVLCISIFILSPYIAEFVFKKPYLTFYFRLVSFGIVPFIFLFIHTECLRGLKNIKLSVFFSQTFIFLFASFILIILVFLSFKYFAVPILSIIISIFVSSIITYLIWIKKIKKVTIKQNHNTITYHFILKTALPMMLANSLALVMGWVDILMLGILDTEKSVGIYNVLLKLIGILNIFILAVDSIFSPKLARLFSQNKLKDSQILVTQATNLLCFSSLPVVLFFIIFPKEILHIFGNDFIIGSSALVILTITRFLRFSLGLAPSILFMSGNQTFYMYALIISIILNVILNYFFIPIYSIQGAAISTLISITFLSLISYTFIYKKFKIHAILNPKFLFYNLYKR